MYFTEGFCAKSRKEKMCNKNTLAVSVMFSYRVAMYLALVVFLSLLTTFSIEAKENHPHSKSWLMTNLFGVCRVKWAGFKMGKMLSGCNISESVFAKHFTCHFCNSILPKIFLHSNYLCNASFT